MAFLADADTTGGNSGSPTVNGKGELVGVNFDRVWENVANDFGYNPEVARNVNVDVRYVLWMLDQVEDADALLRELGVRKGPATVQESALMADTPTPELPVFQPEEKVCGNCKLWSPHSVDHRGWVGPCRIYPGRGLFPPSAPLCDKFAPRGGVTCLSARAGRASPGRAQRGARGAAQE